MRKDFPRLHVNEEFPRGKRRRTRMKPPTHRYLKKHCKKEKTAIFFTNTFFHRSKLVTEGICCNLFLSPPSHHHINCVNNSKSTADRGYTVACESSCRFQAT